MDSQILVVVLVTVVVAVAIGAWFYLRKRRTEHLRAQFGPEYDHVVKEEGDQRRAEAALEMRQKRVERFVIKPLMPADRERFAEEWRSTQARFVDDPHAALAEADSLVSEVMNARGYPVGNFEQRADDVSVDHARLVENYRAAHDIAVRDQSGGSDTEALRNAMVCYRALFDELLGNFEPLRKAV
jgi:hypothetical protein